MSTIADYRSTVIAALQQAALVASRPVTVMPHAGKFTFDELTRKSHQVPAVFFTVLGWRDLSASEQAQYSYLDYGNGSLQLLRLAVGIVCRNVQSAEARNLEAETLAEQITNLLDDNDFNQPHIAVPQSIRAEGLFVPAAEKNGLSLWVVGFEQVAGLAPFDADAQLADFLLAYGRSMGIDDAALLMETLHQMEPPVVDGGLASEGDDYLATSGGQYLLGDAGSEDDSRVRLSSLPVGDALAGNEMLPMVQEMQTRRTSPDAVLAYVQAHLDIPAPEHGFVNSSWTPTPGPVPRVVQQQGWPVDVYTIALAVEIGENDPPGYLLDMLGPDGTGIRIIQTSATSVLFRYFNSTIYDRTLSLTITPGLNRFLIYRSGDTLGVIYNDILQTPTGLPGSEPTDVTWPATVGVCAQTDGANGTVAQAGVFRVLRLIWSDWSLATADDNESIVFDGRSLGAPTTDNAAFIATAGQPSHGIMKGDIVFFWQGILHSVLPRSPSVKHLYGTNANGAWHVWRNAAGDDVMVIQHISGTTGAGGTGLGTFYLPIAFPDASYSFEYTTLNGPVVAKNTAASTKIAVEVNTRRLTDASPLNYEFSATMIWVKK